MLLLTLGGGTLTSGGGPGCQGCVGKCKTQGSTSGSFGQGGKAGKNNNAIKGDKTIILTINTPLTPSSENPSRWGLSIL